MKVDDDLILKDTTLFQSAIQKYKYVVTNFLKIKRNICLIFFPLVTLWFKSSFLNPVCLIKPNLFG